MPPWNDQSNGPGGQGGGQGGGPWGSGPRRPWGQPPRPQPGSQGPDLEDILRQWRERFRFGGNNGGRGGPSARGGWWPILTAILVGGWLISGVYFLDEGEQAVVTRLGAYNRTAHPGAHWHLPPPFEARQIFNVTGQRVDEVGCDRGGRCADPEEGLMITGDRNIVDIHFRVYYNISNIYDFAFNVRDPVDSDREAHQGAVRQVAESAMREVIGRRQLETIITTDRAAVEQEVRQLMQAVLDDYRVGVRVNQVQLLNAAAPPAVIEAFNDVINANQDAETAVNNANRDSARIVNEAEAYKGQTIREAQGEAERFSAVYAEYRQAPQVTRDRIYIETMERVYRNGNLIILDQRSGAVPYLPLESMVRRPAQAQPQAEGTR
jgi:membrane protease subunit HflK